jgi:hypothetical protein
LAGKYLVFEGAVNCLLSQASMVLFGVMLAVFSVNLVLQISRALDIKILTV